MASEEHQSQNTTASASSIPELQDALGSLLLARRSENDTTSSMSCPTSTPNHLARVCPDTLTQPERPRWTGALRLFDFPQELRDEIYFHVLYRPWRVHYTAHGDKNFWEYKGICEDIQNLLVVSKQVYHEAFKVFCLNNTVALTSKYNPRECYRKPLSGLLRLVPDRVASNLTRVSHTYRDAITRPHGAYGFAPSHTSIADGGDGTESFQKKNAAGQTFIEILRDAHTLKQYFPKLVEFEVAWYPEPLWLEFPQPQGQVREIALLSKEGADEKEVAAIWLETMRGWLQGQNVKPLSCVWLVLEGFATDGFTYEFDMLTNEAYRRLVKERIAEPNIEDSGRAWLEEMSKEKTVGRKKKGRKSSSEGA
ncbi:hypothetical protein DDE83_004425 [Stemphylium lycopersici]|uniref:Uncharacterized protein n=1 Tax=Stemphylium lycopersici TaxID=183478 RepID=A0A364N4L6_STELY|nr:hypothetical protein DDE83_004425 [Stemphylium lycopersici]